jgi:predicted metal-dependent phosphoesterase TrpH
MAWQKTERCFSVPPRDHAPGATENRAGIVKDGLAMLKVDLHIHTADDPSDPIPYQTHELIDHAAALGFDAIAITLHDRQLDLRPYLQYAASRHVVLIPGVERTIAGRHVLLLNFSPAAERVQSFEDVARLKAREHGLVIAPHPFFPAGSALRGALRQHADLFDAVEWNAMFTRHVNFNAPAERWAVRHGKPMVGNGDVHRLEQLGTTYSLVDAPPEPRAICDAIAAGRVQVLATPLTLVHAASLMTRLVSRTFIRTPNSRTQNPRALDPRSPIPDPRSLIPDP